MSLDGLGLFKMMAGKLDYLTQRQGVLAHNVANADTPGFKPSDLKAFDFRTVLAQTQSPTMAPVLTNAAHQAGTVVRDTGPGKVERTRRPYETKPDGNAVVIEEQMLKVADTSTEYETLLNLYRKQVGMIRTAIARTGG